MYGYKYLFVTVFLLQAFFMKPMLGPNFPSSPYHRAIAYDSSLVYNCVDLMPALMSLR